MSHSDVYEEFCRAVERETPLADSRNFPHVRPHQSLALPIYRRLRDAFGVRRARLGEASLEASMGSAEPGDAYKRGPPQRWFSRFG